jgi:nicotinate phosphoribosyltransferase
LNPLASPLLTDLYQLTMVHAYQVHRMEGTAVFELFVRRLPGSRNFLIAADFAEYLAKLRFTGDVHAMPEGTVFFADEPVLRVTAPLPEAQLVESRLINLVQLQSMIASKAARCVIAAPGKQLVDFGLRQAHGAEAGLLAARATYLAGFAGSATVLAAATFGIPVFGTMAHSFIQAHDDEGEAFARFAEVFPTATTVLIDTYDTEEAARKLVALARELTQRGIRLHGVRLDSGDLATLARSVRAILDSGGLGGAKIYASGDLDEWRIRELRAAGAPIDGFGLGTSVVTSPDAPSLDAVYKLQEYAGKPRRKRSAGKATWPGRKQVFRYYDAVGRMHHDIVGLEDDACGGEPLLARVMANGRRVEPFSTLAQARQRTASQIERLPDPLRRLEKAAAPYPVTIAETVKALAREADAARLPPPSAKRASVRAAINTFPRPGHRHRRALP